LSYRAGGPKFDLLASKLRRPAGRPGLVRRSSLIERLVREDSRPVVSVFAPAGYGKTTLLSQWAERAGHAFAWVSVDEKDNDPKVLLTYIAEALGAIEPLGDRTFAALADPASSVPGLVVPRLVSAFASMTAPVVLVLDDVHLLHNRECQAALSLLADHVPPGSRLALAGRTQPPLRIPRLRAEGRVTEIGPRDLSLTRAEAALLLTGAEVALRAGEVTELHRRTEGWPVGLYLAALAVREGGSTASFGGGDLFVSGYVESEFLAHVSAARRVFLTRTAVLERMSGPLCEAVLGLPGSGAALADLARSNLLLVPLDRQGQWYRYHHLFRDTLLAELERAEPGLMPVIRRRAADWYLRSGLPEDALEYSIAAGDADTVARLAGRLWLPACRQGRVSAVQRWLGWLDDRGSIEGYPMVAVAAACLAVRTGRPAEADRWADVVDRWVHQDTSQPVEPWLAAWAAVLRALLCRRGAGQMRADADEAASKCAVAGIVAPPVIAALRGLARLLSGDVDGADAMFADAVSAGQEGAAPDVLAEALCERSLLAMARGDWDHAESLAGEAATVAHRTRTEDVLVCAVRARVAVHRGDVPAARRHLASAQQLRPALTYIQPHLAVQVRIELARVHLALADLAGARVLLREIYELFERRPGLGSLAGEAEALRARIAQERGSSLPGASALTDAELRLLPLLPTHLSVPELAAELFLSPHTIKSRMKSIYRKLDATTRHQVVTRARELGLLESYERLG
jgi:LuxR family transcriptional regulator, maltose regulon positive regulatory protein